MSLETKLLHALVKQASSLCSALDALCDANSISLCENSAALFPFKVSL